MKGRAIAQAVSRRLPTAAARVQTRVWSCGILWWTEVALLRTSVSPANLHFICFSTIIFTFTRGWHNKPGVAAVPIASQTRIKKNRNPCLSVFMLIAVVILTVKHMGHLRVRRNNSDDSSLRSKRQNEFIDVGLTYQINLFSLLDWDRISIRSTILGSDYWV
jgi:hypothetical protein